MSLRINKTEAWALNIVSRVQNGAGVEDSRVELKREWPDQKKAARRIAGHANSCFGSDILWIVGLDEVEGVIGAQAEELANWWPKVCSYFDGVTPALTDILLPIYEKTLVCLLFETGRPPYLVKNPKYGSPGGGPVNWEVPWREGTSIRTATRNDLVRMLIPTLAQPEIEVLGGSGHLSQKEQNFPGDEVVGKSLSFEVSTYIYPRVDSSVVIPFHKCQCVLSDDFGHNIDEFEFTMRRPHRYGNHGATPDTVTIERTSSELIAHGPGRCSIGADTVLPEEPSWFHNDELNLRFLIYVIDSELPVEVNVKIKQESPGNDDIRKWFVINHG